MKRKLVMMAAIALSLSCMTTVPVAASENVAEPVGVEAKASIYSPDCPDCPGAKSTYLFEQPDGFGHTMVFMQCNECGQIYHYYV